MDTPVSKDAPKATGRKLRHPLRELTRDELARFGDERTELSKHFERQSRAEALETDIPTGVVRVLSPLFLLGAAYLTPPDPV